MYVCIYYIYIYLSIHVLKGKSCVGECLALIWKDLANYVVLYIYINIHKLLPMHKFKTSNGNAFRTSCSKFASTSTTRQLRNLQLLSCRFSLLKLILKKMQRTQGPQSERHCLTVFFSHQNCSLCRNNLQRGLASTLVRRLRPWESRINMDVTWCATRNTYFAIQVLKFHAFLKVASEKPSWGLYIVSPNVGASFWVAQPIDLPTPGIEQIFLRQRWRWLGKTGREDSTFAFQLGHCTFDLHLDAPFRWKVSEIFFRVTWSNGSMGTAKDSL